jgi:hypothetical protein
MSLKFWYCYRGQRGVPEEGPRVRDFKLAGTHAHSYYDEGYYQLSLATGLIINN